MRLSHLFLYVLLLCLPVRALAQADSPWRARWIGVVLEDDAPATRPVREGETREGLSPPNQWLCFRGSLELEERPARALARIAVDSRYWLWVNGRLAVYEGGLKRGPTPRDSYYDEVDLAPWLVGGENTIALLVWHFGKDGFSHKSSGRAGLCFELEGCAQVSDANWRARVHPAYGDPQPFAPFPNYRLPESDVRYDARLALEGWTATEFDDSGWPAALELGTPPCAPWNELVRRPTPQLRDLGRHAYVASETEELEGGARLVRCRLPVNATVHPWMRLRAPAGLVVDVRTDNYRGGGDRNLRHQYVTRAGLQEYECLSYLNGQEVLYSLPAGLEVLELGYRETRYDSDALGSFECDQEFFVRLREKALNTLWLNLRDGIQDPDRERAQWWGDVLNVMPQLFVTLDERAHPLVAKAVRNLVDWQRPDGSLYSPVPSGTWNRELPLQMLASVGEYGVARYVLYSADLELLREVYPRLRRYLELWRVDDDGLVVRRPGEWTWIDWGEHKDAALAYDAWYHLALRGDLRMARWTDDVARVRQTEQQLARHAQAFRAAYWTGTEFRSPGHEGPPDDRGNALAVLAGLSRPEDAAALERLLLEERHASPYMERFVLEALFELGDGSAALERMRARYAPMVENAATTLWERWDLDPRHSSYNHGWSGSPLALLSECVAGVTPLAPGYARFLVRPRMGTLTSVRAVVPTIAGRIRVRLERSDDRLDLEVDVPEGTIALIDLGSLSARPWTRVSVDEQPVAWPRSVEDPASLLELTGGRHRLRAER